MRINLILLIPLMLSLCLPAAAASSEDSRSIEATTALTLPVDSVTIYPGGLMAVKRGGSLDVTEGLHEFVINLPAKADKSSALLSVSNATLEKVVYEATPIYTLNITSAGSQRFDLSYLMPRAASWQPRYDLHLKNDSILVKASAVVKNQGGEDLKDVRLKLVAGPAPGEPSFKEALQFERSLALASAAPAEVYNETVVYESVPTSTGELETFYIFELDGRKELVADKEIGYPLFEAEAPLLRIFTWDAYYEANGPAKEEIRANNTLQSPWPSGDALLYKDGDYVSTIEMPYTPSGTNATIDLGPSADLKVESRLADYNMTENIKEIESEDGNYTIKETIEDWTYNLSIISNLDRPASLEVKDTKPLDAKIISISPKPVEITATSLMWKIELSPREKTAINYTYEATTIESLDSEYYY